MANGREFDRPGIYHIRVKGNLDTRWSDWFGGMCISHTDNDETLLAGQVTDQAALHGMLAKIRDLGLPLLSVTRLEASPDSDQH